MAGCGVLSAGNVLAVSVGVHLFASDADASLVRSALAHLVVGVRSTGGVLDCYSLVLDQRHLEAGTKKWLYCAIGCSFASVVVCIFMVAVWKKLALIVQLLRETGQALSSMMGLICIPMLVR